MIELMQELSPCCNAPIVYKHNCSICGEPVTDTKQMLKEISNDSKKRTTRTQKESNISNFALLQHKAL